VDKAGNETRLSAITRLLDRAQEEKPATALAADRVATWFVSGVLIAAALTFVAWSLIAPERAFSIALAVLVATCPAPCHWPHQRRSPWPPPPCAKKLPANPWHHA